VGDKLSVQQIEQYRDAGWVSPVPVMSSDAAATARSKLETHEATLGHPVDASQRSKCHLLFRWVDDIMRDDQVLDAVEDLIGPNILCWNTILWIKEPQTASYVGWHQDLSYWGLDNDELVTVWVALSPASEASGCMSVIPGSHHQLLQHDETWNKDNLLTRGQELSIDPAEYPIVAMALEPGQASFHNVRSAHGSGSNTTDDRRIGLSMHFMPTHTRQKLSDWDSAALVRGSDDYGHFEHSPQPMHDFDPVAVEFHRRASKALRDIVYAGTEPDTTTL
jgi:non-heme Fe2+,alpha-ketoglutarate-dependent halogenase